MSTDLIVKEVNFNGVNLIGIQKNGKVFVAVKRICDDLGIDSSAQFKRIKKDGLLNEGMALIAIPTQTGLQEHFCLDIEFLPFWLTGISETRCKSEIQPHLKEFKRKAKDILAEAFLNKQPTQPALPQDYESALEALLTSVKKQKKLTIELTETKHQVESLAPMAAFAACQMNLIQKVPLSLFGKYLSSKVPGMGRNRISSFLVEQKLLFRNKRNDIEIYAKYLSIDSNSQYFDLKERSYLKPVIQNGIKIGEERVTDFQKMILKSGMVKVIELCYRAKLINDQQFYSITNDLPNWINNAECEIDNPMEIAS